MEYTMSFIEKQFPVSKVSKESYKERKAVQSQTLTTLGKWWGRKPLILVRATAEEEQYQYESVYTRNSNDV